MGGRNTFGKIFYFLGVLALIYLSIKNPSTFHTGWLILYLLIGIILIRNSLALTVFFAINILLSLVLYVQHGYLKYIGLVLIALIAFIASIGAVKPRRIAGKKQRQKRAVKLERKAEQIKKELDGVGNNIPAVEVYGKEDKKTEKTKPAGRKKAKKTRKKAAARKKTSKRKTKTKKSAKRKAGKKTKRKSTKKRSTSKKTKRKTKSKRTRRKR
ncbi:hypothetical protein GF371_03165 [Candidatus Woesearchaeota archaeon]|nr:hypothetical protein [Candidatus Woesearchaeota archaeon]